MKHPAKHINQLTTSNGVQVRKVRVNGKMTEAPLGPNHVLAVVNDNGRVSVQSVRKVPRKDGDS